MNARILFGPRPNKAFRSNYRQKSDKRAKRLPKIIVFQIILSIFEAGYSKSLKTEQTRTIPTYYNMEEYKKNGMSENDKEIVFSQAIKAGKRIYYVDVKKNRREEMYISITESKKLVSGEGENASVSFEKHKIFLYREDFAKFANSLNEAINYIVAEQGEYIPRYPETPAEEKEDGKVNIDIDF